jgi:hypothetical protein
MGFDSVEEELHSSSLFPNVAGSTVGTRVEGQSFDSVVGRELIDC